MAVVAVALQQLGEFAAGEGALALFFAFGDLPVVDRGGGDDLVLDGGAEPGAEDDGFVPMGFGGFGLAVVAEVDAPFVDEAEGELVEAADAAGGAVGDELVDDVAVFVDAALGEAAGGVGAEVPVAEVVEAFAGDFVGGVVGGGFEGLGVLGAVPFDEGGECFGFPDFEGAGGVGIGDGTDGSADAGLGGRPIDPGVKDALAFVEGGDFGLVGVGHWGS